MRKDIHPEYHKINATCACGNEVAIGSVNEEMKVLTQSREERQGNT